VLCRGALDAGQRNGLVKTGQAATPVHGQRQQVEVGDLVVTLHALEIDMAVVAQRDVVGPELVVQRRAGLLQPFTHPLYRQAAVAPVAGQTHHADDAIFDQRAGGDLHAALFDEGVGAVRELVRVIEQRHPDIHIQQGPHGGWAFRCFRVPSTAAHAAA
jgi:hypothetical protein